ncbi:ribonuclease H-like domain-containing protein [Tanacetum coccineum]
MSVYNSDNGDDHVEDPITLISKLDINDPLHLHLNDSTALTVVSIKLKGNENYQVWSCVMLLALEGKNKTDFIDGSCIRSNTDELNALWKQFDAMVELPKCVSNASESFKKHNQLMKLMQFLMGLDDSYMQIKSYILSREVLPDIRSVYATISSEESHRVAYGSIDGIMVILLIDALKSLVILSSSRFTDEQMATLISLIKDNKIEKNVQVNMAEANQHMTYTNKELDNVFDISYLKIKDVLVIPAYCVTLISVHKLFKENKIIVAFDETREDLMEAIQAFLKEYDHIPPNEKCMALLLAEERFLKIKQEQNQPRVMQELLLKLMDDLQIEFLKPKVRESRY